MKIALAQVNPTIGGFQENVDHFVDCAAKALAQGCDLVVFPELALSGYPPKDFLEHRQFVKEGIKALDSFASKVRGIGVLCGVPTPREGSFGKPLYNTAVLFEDGRILAEIHKQLLPTYDVFDETRYFEPGPLSMPVTFRGRSIGITVCEDAWNDPELVPQGRYRVEPIGELVKKGADLLINIAASPFELEKPRLRERIFSHLAGKYGVPFVFVNTVGGQDSLVFDGHSLVVAPDGRVIARASGFAEALVASDIETGGGDPGSDAESDEEVLIKALSLSLYDYMRRCGFKKAVLGLSGGVDSAVTASIAARAIGRENVLGVLMPSPYTSRESIQDATRLAENLGIELLTIPIEGLFKGYLETLSPIFIGRKPDTTEENIQARIRGNLLMAISNKFGHLVLSTGNKSELAVGYCTLYGDLSGGYALISDVPKTMVYRIARHLNATGAGIPERILTRPPSAELRPEQKDQDDLPPYDLLDTILELHIERNASREEIISRGYDPALVGRILSMIARSEYKRLQAPLGPKVTTKAFGYGRRYPLAHSYRW